jgi:hypothetical protein
MFEENFTDNQQLTGVRTTVFSSVALLLRCFRRERIGFACQRFLEGLRLLGEHVLHRVLLIRKTKWADVDRTTAACRAVCLPTEDRPLSPDDFRR